MLSWSKEAITLTSRIKSSRTSCSESSLSILTATRRDSSGDWETVNFPVTTTSSPCARLVRAWHVRHRFIFDRFFKQDTDGVELWPLKTIKEPVCWDDQSGLPALIHALFRSHIWFIGCRQHFRSLICSSYHNRVAETEHFRLIQSTLHHFSCSYLSRPREIS